MWRGLAWLGRAGQGRARHGNKEEIMVDVSKTIAPKSDQLNADDLIAGPKTITITRVTGHEDSDQPVWIFFDGDRGKPYKPGLSMRRVLVLVWGQDSDDYIGRSMTLYNDPEIKFGGIKVGGIRISHMSHISKAVGLMLTSTRGKKAQHTVKPLLTDPKEAAMSAAEEAARDGAAAFADFWNSPRGKECRDLIRPELDRLKSIAVEADEAKKSLSQRIRESEQQDDQKPSDASPPQADASPAPADEDGPHWTAGIARDQGFPGAAEFDEGKAARVDGKPLEDCPYKDEPEKAADWIGGWEAGDDSE
jgi:ribosome modulation factor